MDELQEILTAARDREHRQNKFTAALKGVDIDKGIESEMTVEDVKRRIEARRTGKTEEQIDFAELGIAVVYEE